MEALVVTQAAHDVRPSAHRTGNDSHIAIARPHSAFARDEDLFAVMLLNRDVVVMTVDRSLGQLELRDFARLGHRVDDLFHHQLTVVHGELLGPTDGLDVVVEMYG